MKKRQENKATMYYTVRRLGKRREAEVSLIPAFYDSLLEFNNLVDQFSVQRKIQEREDAGITLDKDVLESSMVSLAVKIANKIVVYAVKVSNYSLAESVRTTESQLKHLRDTRTMEECKRIYETAVKYEAELEYYGVKSDKIAELNDLVLLYEYMMTGPRDATGERKSAKEEMERLMTEIDKVLVDGMDKMVDLFDELAPDFISEYHSARIIIDLGIHHNKPDDADGGGTDTTGVDATTGK